LAELDDPLERAVAALKEPVRVDPGLTGRVMSEIDRLARSGARPRGAPSLSGWWRRRWTIQLNPVSGLALAAGLAALVVGVGRLTAPRAVSGPPPSGPNEAAASAQRTQFVLVAPKAASVTVVGDFNDWSLSATPLAREAGDGVWWVTVALPPGRYRYSFVVDGTTWLSDPEAPAVEDEFGRPNSVVTIGGP